jgi:hypothetical protein
LLAPVALHLLLHQAVRLLRRLPQLVVFERIAPGIYQADEKFPVYVLVATELSLEPRNYPLLLLGTEEQRRSVIQVWVQEGRERELTLAAELFPETVREVMKMAGKRREPIDIEANLRYLADWLGPEPLLAGLSLEERLAGLSVEERRRLRDLLLADEAVTPRSRSRSKAGTPRRTPDKRRAS